MKEWIRIEKVFFFLFVSKVTWQTRWASLKTKLNIQGWVHWRQTDSRLWLNNNTDFDESNQTHTHRPQLFVGAWGCDNESINSLQCLAVCSQVVYSISAELCEVLSYRRSRGVRLQIDTNSSLSETADYTEIPSGLQKDFKKLAMGLILLWDKRLFLSLVSVV